MLGAGGELELAQAGAHAHEPERTHKAAPPARGTNGAVSWTADLDPRLAEHGGAARDDRRAPRRSTTAEWRLVYLTSQFRFFAGDKSMEELGLGRHAVSIRAAELHGMVPDEVELRWLRTNIPLMAHDTPGGADAIRAMLPDDARAGARPARAARAADAVVGRAHLPPARAPARPDALPDVRAHRARRRARRLGDPLPAGRAREHRLADHARQPGHVRPHGGAAAARPPRDRDPVRRHPGVERARAPPLLAALVRADPRLPRPRPTRPRSAAPGSSASHAGDGMTAFFLAEHAGSRAAACAAALEAGREIVDWRPPGMERGELKINAGVHWGGALLARGGRHRRPARGDRPGRRGQRVRAHPAVGARRGTAGVQAAGRAPRARTRAGSGSTRDHRLPHGRGAPGRDPKAIRDAGAVPVVTVPRQSAR